MNIENIFTGTPESVNISIWNRVNNRLNTKPSKPEPIVPGYTLLEYDDFNIFTNNEGKRYIKNKGIVNTQTNTYTGQGIYFDTNNAIEVKQNISNTGTLLFTMSSEDSTDSKLIEMGNLSLELVEGKSEYSIVINGVKRGSGVYHKKNIPQNVAIWWKDNRWRVYVNGTLKDSSSFTNPIQATSLVLGKGYKGTLSNIILLNGAISVGKISAYKDNPEEFLHTKDMELKSNIIDTNLVLKWLPCTETTNVVYDVKEGFKNVTPLQGLVHSISPGSGNLTTDNNGYLTLDNTLSDEPLILTIPLPKGTPTGYGLNIEVETDNIYTLILKENKESTPKTLELAKLMKGSYEGVFGTFEYDTIITIAIPPKSKMVFKYSIVVSNSLYVIKNHVDRSKASALPYGLQKCVIETDSSGRYLLLDKGYYIGNGYKGHIKLDPSVIYNNSSMVTLELVGKFENTNRDRDVMLCNNSTTWSVSRDNIHTIDPRYNGNSLALFTKGKCTFNFTHVVFTIRQKGTRVVAKCFINGKSKSITIKTFDSKSIESIVELFKTEQYTLDSFYIKYFRLVAEKAMTTEEVLQRYKELLPNET